MNNSYDDSNTSGCTRDDALGIMIGVGRIRILPPKDDATPEERETHDQINFTLADYLNERYADLSSDYAEAKFDKLPPAIIAEKLAAFNEIKSQIKDAVEVAPYLDDEIAKLAIGKPSALRFDVQCISKLGAKRYSLKSVEECGKKIRAKILDDKNSGRIKKFPLQEKAILDELRRREHDPKDLQKGDAGNDGVQAVIRNVLVGTDLFDTKKAFNRVWERMINAGTLVMK